jgi:hypothetical protein
MLLFWGAIGFIVHPIQTIKAIFESWHAGQHATAQESVFLTVNPPKTDEEIEEIRQRFLNHYKNQGGGPR